MDKKPSSESDPIEAALEKIKLLRAKQPTESRLSSLEEDRVANLVPPVTSEAPKPRARTTFIEKSLPPRDRE